MRRALTPAVAGIALTCAACAALSSLFGISDRIRFSHARHKQAKVDCIACHETIFDQKTLGEAGAMPEEAKCLECHKAQKEKGNCAFCHSDPSHPAAFEKRAPHLKLSHADHIPRVEEKCEVCHTALPEPGDVDRPMPAMSSCTGCHEHQQAFADARCDACHVDLARYPIKPVSTFSHQGDFLRRHPISARATGGETCAECHEQTFCTECHGKTVSAPIEVKYPERVDRNFIHRGDYLSRHAMDRVDPTTCNRCHSSSFCVDCHTSQSLTTASANPRDPHPPDWSFPGSPNSHAVAARRDISGCASCHDQGSQSICISCHKVGGVGGNPHPPFWLTRHNRSEIAHNSMCLYCHQ